VSGEITKLLRAVSSGSDDAVSRLFEIVYEDLRARARAQLAGSAPQTLSATALVHEAYLKLTAGDSPEWNDRAHFYGVAATAMRHIAIDHARARQAQRRGGGGGKVNIDIAQIPIDDAAESLLDLDSALDALAKRSDRLAKLVELRFFAGLSVEDSATALSMSPRTVKRDWRTARAFIHAKMSS
jgi:RNA polymerase sigma factor (TIGR02999 family)